MALTYVSLLPPASANGPSGVFDAQTAQSSVNVRVTVTGTPGFSIQLQSAAGVALPADVVTWTSVGSAATTAGTTTIAVSPSARYFRVVLAGYTSPGTVVVALGYTAVSGGGGGGGGGSPTGAASGDLGGTYPSPTVTATHLGAALPVGQGGTGQATQQAAIDALTGTQSAGKVLRSDGTHATLATLQAGDVPTLNQDTTGTAAAANALKSATTTVNTSSATAPTNGQVLTATSGTAATWQAPAAPLPLTTLGDTLYENVTPAAARLAGNTSATKNFLTQTGTGSVSAAPAWGTIAAGDVPQLAAYAPAGLTGATAASRYAGATTSGAPTSGTFSTGDWVIDQSGPLIWICTTGGTPGTWTRAGDKPHQFRPESYGALRDGKMVTDGAMTNGSNILACTTSTPFTAADVGKSILVWAAASASTYLFTTISGYTDTGHVTLTANATANTSAVNAGVGVVYGTDDTAAIQSAVNAATTYSQGGSGALAQVLLSEGIYCSSTAATLGNATGGGNSAITLPIITATSGVKAQVQIIGVGSSQLPHWLQANPPQSGSVICAMRTNGSLNNTYGPTTIIGGPVSGYGGGGGTFSNMHLRLQGFTILVPMSTGAYCGPDLYGIGQGTVDDVSYLPLAVVPTSGTNANAGPWPPLATYGGPTYYPTYSFGLRMPASGNNAVSDIGSFTSYFTQISLIGSEHTTFASLKTLYSVYGILPQTTSGGNSHGISGVNWCCEAVRYPLGSVSSGYYVLSSTIGIVVARCSLEVYTDIVNDAASKLYGEIAFDIIAAPGGYLATQYAAGGTGVKLKRIEATQGPIASPQAAPATTVAWPNYYYRDAWVTVSLSGGNTFTSLNIDAVAQPNAAGAGTYSFMLPSGHSYTPTYSAGTLTHTVSLQ